MKVIPIYVSIGLFVGFMYNYSFSGDPKIIVKSKNTEMLGKVMYVDNNDRCYKYKKSEILCPLDKTIKVISI